MILFDMDVENRTIYQLKMFKMGTICFYNNSNQFSVHFKILILVMKRTNRNYFSYFSPNQNTINRKK